MVEVSRIIIMTPLPVPLVLQKVGVEVPYPGIDHTQYTGPYPPPKSLIRQHKYYQWVSFFLFFQVRISASVGGVGGCGRVARRQGGLPAASSSGALFSQLYH